MAEKLALLEKLPGCVATADASTFQAAGQIPLQQAVI